MTMFRIRRVMDDSTPANRTAIAEVQAIIRAQFPKMDTAEIDKLPEQMRDPMKYRFRSIILVAEKGSEQVKAFALLLYAPDLNFCYLEEISAAPGKTGGGLGSILYDRVREEALSLGVIGLFYECLPDDPALSPDAGIRKQNADRLRFYERFGARPIENTAYETPLQPDGTNPPYLMFDGLGRDTLPSRDQARQIARAILERKYGDVCPPSYVDMVVESFQDDPIRIRPPRYIRRAPVATNATGAEPLWRIPIVVNDKHEIHHVRDRGYVQAPVRIRSILGELDRSNLFERMPARHFPESHIRAVHDGTLVNYIKNASLAMPEGKSLYPYVFPIRNPARPPKEASVRAGYYCIDTFTPINSNAYKAARGAVDCALTAAERLLSGRPLVYALVRPPGHHAERKAFGGFCYFNNSAIAADFLSRYGKVAVLDIDYHHGNGTQDIFYTRDDVLTVSIHGHPSFAYPYFSGFKEETGQARGEGFNINFPLPETIKPEQYRETLRQALRRIEKFEPSYLVVATGFDTAKGDPTGTWANRPDDFTAIGEMIGAAGYPTLVVQEGGYRIRTLGANARHFFTGMWGKASEAQMARPAKPAAKGRKQLDAEALSWREEPLAGDAETVRRLIEETKLFAPDEVRIAGELVEDRLAKGEASDYRFLFADEGGRMVGYTCYGRIDGTQTSYDLYWIGVEKAQQGLGLGAKLLERTEALIAKLGGKRIYVDTSTSEAYVLTRRFYAKNGYTLKAELPDFYKPGDGKAIFEKAL
jgi:acetoin utilization deacetylase AcuC-like enzyme/GNAT superfamily N-acetyltransferase